MIKNFLSKNHESCLYQLYKYIPIVKYLASKKKL